MLCEVRSSLLASSLLRASGVPFRIQSGGIGAGLRSAAAPASTTIDLDMTFSECNWSIPGRSTGHAPVSSVHIRCRIRTGEMWCKTSRFCGGLVRRLPAATISPRLGLSKRQRRQVMTARRSVWGRDSWGAQREPFETVALLSASDLVDGRADLLRDQLEDLQYLTERVASEVEHHVGEPERLVRGELVHDGLARVGGQSVPQGYADRQRDGLERPARGVRQRAQAIDARGELRWGLRRGVPAIAERHDTPKGARAVPADPDRRMRLLDRLGGEADVVESIELAREAWVVGRPQLLEDAEDLVGLPPASVERRVEDRELLLPPSDAHTADEPPVGQRVDRRQHLRHHDRVAVAEDEDRRADAWPRGRDRGGRKDCDRLEVGRVGREGEASAGVPAGGRSREDHVVAHPERSDLAVLRLSAEGEQRLARRDGALRRQVATDVHSGLGIPATERLDAPVPSLASVHGDEDTVAQLAVERLGAMPLAPRVLDEDHLAGADPSRLAVARGDLHARVEIDDVLPPRGGMPIQVVLGLDLAKDDPGGGKACGQPPGAARIP